MIYSNYIIVIKHIFTYFIDKSIGTCNQVFNITNESLFESIAYELTYWRID